MAEQTLMANAGACEHLVRSVSLQWREPFVLRRLAAGLLLSLLPFAVCLAFKAGVLALGVLAIGSYPWPVWVEVSDRGVSLRWLFVRQTLPSRDLVRASLIRDARRWAWPRRTVLVLERTGKPQLVLFGREATLLNLQQAARALLASRPPPDENKR